MMGCPRCKETRIVDHPSVEGLLSYACGYRRGASLRVRDTACAINGSRVVVLRVHPVTGMFFVESTNLNGLKQWLWYDRNGLCWANGKRWHGDDIIIAGELIDSSHDGECGGLPRCADGSRWDEI
jgi:hypothetical protein